MASQALNKDLNNLPETGEDESKNSKTLLVLQKELLDLTLRANGKTDLYFHAYFWSTFCFHLYLRENHSEDAKKMENYENIVVKTSIEL